MADPTKDFIRDYQALAQQSWDAWTRQLQQQPPVPPPMNHAFFTPPTAGFSSNDTLERSLSGLKGFFDWMQAAAASGQAGTQPADWQQQLQRMFAGSNPAFTQAFAGIDSVGAEGFGKQWQSWMQALQNSPLGELPGAHGPTPAFGLNREQQMQQQAMAVALMESLQASARYQALVQRANSEGMERLQNKLAVHAEPGRQIDSLKGLYDLWVDAAEEAYAEIALSDEFRDAYAEMINTQMRVRHMQQQQTEQFCQQLGMPTRSDVSALGQRLQAMRRELAALKAGVADAGQTAAKQDGSAVKTSVQETSPDRKSAPAAAAARTPAARKPALKKARASKASTPRARPRKAVASKVQVKASRKTAGKAGPVAASRPSSRKRT
ncbi:MAG: pha synthase subunit protein [Pseudomonadota bacterium]|nr:pha synthase subunit protein [Pseudomonadota bacterium]